MLDTLENIILNISDPHDRVIDLFAGTGTVSRKISNSRPVSSVDIQEYSRVICSALLNTTLDDAIIDKILSDWHNNDFSKKIDWAVEPLIKFENNCISEALKGDPANACDLVESGSIIKFQMGERNIKNTSLKDALEETVSRLKFSNLNDTHKTSALRYSGGIFISYKQSKEIDKLLHLIDSLPLEYKDTLKSITISIMSNIVNTVGKQFAQPIKPRKKDGTPKSNLGERLQKDRNKEVRIEFENWVKKYKSLPKTKFDCKAIKSDYLDALYNLPDDAKIVYADPPYTRDHYSRYYHVLETICLRDNPDLSKVKIGGVSRISRGIYRKKRHQSPFCIKSKAPEAFENLFGIVSSKNLKLVLSYSPYQKEDNTRPRLIGTDDLINMANNYFESVELIYPTEITHSKLNNSNMHLDKPKKAEIVLVCE